MIRNLEVRNFKSLKHLRLDCRRVNVFIGRPNTGKSNILESVGIFSLSQHTDDLRDFVRLEDMTNLFCNTNLEGKIEITTDNDYCEIVFRDERFYVEVGDKEKKVFGVRFDCDYNATSGSIGAYPGISPYKFYRFQIMRDFRAKGPNFLLPPRGANLLRILQTNAPLNEVVRGLFTEYGLWIAFRSHEGKIEVLKEITKGVFISYPYSLVSDTLQRVVFHFVAMETNKDSVIVFEEPEAHAFPYYTKFLAERVALDTSNQYFISTHNPYFLLPLLEKTPKEDARIFITYFEDYQTKVRPLGDEEIPEILDLDASIFFNLDRFLPEQE